MYKSIQMKRGGYLFFTNNPGGYGYNNMGSNPGGFNPFSINPQDKKTISKDCFKLGILLVIFEFLQNFLGRAFYYVVYTIREHKLIFLWENVVKYYKDNRKLLTSTTFSMSLNLTVTLVSVITVLLLAKFAFHIGEKQFLKPDKEKIKTGFKWFPGCYLANIVFTYIGSMLIAMMNSSGMTVPDADFTIRQPSTAAIIIVHNNNCPCL